ncbi:hypothetical protein JCM10213_004817, partial [Rhodosporidiobolus nylandii]
MASLRRLPPLLASSSSPSAPSITSSDTAIVAGAIARRARGVLALFANAASGAVAVYEDKAEDEKEAEHICERVIPQFQHANGSVVLAAIKVIMIHIDTIPREEFVKNILRKMAPPLGAL